jgi:hypothetical protein
LVLWARTGCDCAVGARAAQNAISKQIAALIGRPASDGHLGEYVGSVIFGIDLERSAANKGFDGRFRQGPFAGKTVNLKWKGKRDGTLNLSREVPPPDFYLVLTGQESPAGSSRGADRPWFLEAVYLFEAPTLVNALVTRGVQIGVATGVAKEFWSQAQIFPEQQNGLLVLEDRQRKALVMFGANKGV